MGLKSIKVENYSQNQYEIKGNGYKDKKEKEHFFRKDPYAGYKDDKELIKIKERSLDLTKVKNYVKEIALLAIATVLIGIGYSNYSEEETMQVASLQNEASIGDARLVSSNAIVDNDETEKDESNANVNSNDKSLENINTNAQENQDYFSTTKLERETMYSQKLETYQKMIENEQLTNEQKAIAMQEVSKITEEKNAIQIAENLIKNKGYENVVILKNDENVNVVIKAKKLETEDIAKLQNIITRELKVDLSKVNISSK
jgi:stage III sporulation protein AH